MLTCLLTSVVSRMSSWPVAWTSFRVIAFPTILVVMPLARRLVFRLVAAPRG